MYFLTNTTTLIYTIATNGEQVEKKFHHSN